MRIKCLLIAVIFTLSQSVWAKCPEDVQVINKGEIANCDGLLFSPEASKQVDETQEDAKYYKDLSDKLQVRRDYADKEINILDKRLHLYIQQSEILAKEVYRKEREDKWQKFLYFGLGVLATGIAVHGASELNR